MGWRYQSISPAVYMYMLLVYKLYIPVTATVYVYPPLCSFRRFGRLSLPTAFSHSILLHLLPLLLLPFLLRRPSPISLSIFFPHTPSFSSSFSFNPRQASRSLSLLSLFIPLTLPHVPSAPSLCFIILSPSYTALFPPLFLSFSLLSQQPPHSNLEYLLF